MTLLPRWIRVHYRQTYKDTHIFSQPLGILVQLYHCEFEINHDEIYQVGSTRHSSVKTTMGRVCLYLC